jgi:Ser/Thr protein kinase RdoA (MazF antagonist)
MERDTRLAPWGLSDATTEPISEGYNSRTWHVHVGGARYVAKRVGGARSVFEAGLRVAEQLEERGFRAGGPIRTLTGELTVPSEGEWLALLRYVPGNPVPLDTRMGLETWGLVMGRVHSLLADIPRPANLPHADAVDLEAPHLSVAPWLRSAVAAATKETNSLTGLTLGIIHNDGCEPRRDDATGELAVIDWNAAGYGPFVSDVGTARWQFQSYGNRPSEEFGPFLDAYLREAPISPSELAHVDAFVRLRVAMSGWYFAWRIHEGYTTGADDDWNRAGLEQAQRLWQSLRR